MPHRSYFCFGLCIHEKTFKNRVNDSCQGLGAVLSRCSKYKGVTLQVSASSQNSSLIAARYAGALLDLAEEKKALSKVEKDIADLRVSLENSKDFQNAIASPLIGKDKQSAFVDAIAKKAKLSELTANFLSVLVANGRLNVLGAALKAFEAEVSKRRGEVQVSVKTAQDLSAKQLKSLQATLKKHVGSDVSIDADVDPSILGGMVVTIGSQMIDDSVRRKLDRLKHTMSAQSNSGADLKAVS